MITNPRAWRRGLAGLAELAGLAGLAELAPECAA